MVTVMLVCWVGATLLLMSQPRIYTATTLVNFLPKANAGLDLNATMEYANKQATVFAQLAKTPLILDPVAQDLGLGESGVSLARTVSSAAALDQPLVTVSVNDRDPQKAARVANAVGQQLIKALPSYAPPDAVNAITVSISSPATVPTEPSSPNFRTSALVALLVGVALAGLQALIRAFFNIRVKSIDDLARVTPLPVMGQIPRTAGGTSGFSITDEAFAALRTNLEFRALEGGTNVILITSALPGEGKTSTAVGVARAFAKRERKVLLMDCDLRRPRVHHEITADPALGLTQALLRSVPVSELVQHVEGMDVLVAGRRPPNPAELMASKAMADLIEVVRAEYEVVIIDAPPLLPVTDAVALSRTGAGVLVVVEAARVRRRQLHDALGSLETVKSTMLGIVLNKITSGSKGYYGYGYKYGSDGARAASAPGPVAIRRRSGRPRASRAIK